MSAAPAILRPTCMGRVDALALADRLISAMEAEGDEVQLDSMLAQAEAASNVLTPTTIRPSLYQKFWRLRFFSRTLELPTTRILTQLLRAHGGVFVDVGAHVGYFSIIAAVAGAEEIVAVEMHPDNWRLLKQNVPQAHCVLAAAGREIGNGEYFLGKGHSNHSLHLRGDTSSERRATTFVTLDDLMCHRRAQTPCFVKIDVQGHEADTLRGFEQGLRARDPIIIFEVERHVAAAGLDDPYIDAIDMLMGLEYRLFLIREGELAEVRSPASVKVEGFPPSANILAVPDRAIDDFVYAIHRRDLE